MNHWKHRTLRNTRVSLIFARETTIIARNAGQIERSSVPRRASTTTDRRFAARCIEPCDISILEVSTRAVERARAQHGTEPNQSKR